MICPKCNNVTKEGTKFCSHCGSALAESYGGGSAQATIVKDPVTTNVQTKQKTTINKKIFVLIMIVAVLIISAIAAISVYNNPTNKMNRYIKAGEIEEAYDIYLEKLNEKDLSEKTIELLSNAIEQVISKYDVEELTYDEAYDSLFNIRSFSSYEIDAELSEAYDYINLKYQAQQALETANKHLSKGDNLTALQAFQNILNSDSSNQEAALGLSKAESAYKNEVLALVDSNNIDGSFDYSRNLINNALLYLPDDVDLTRALSDVDLREEESIIKNAENYYANGDYFSAIEIYQRILNTNPDSQAATAGIAKVEDAYRTEILRQAEVYKASGDFDTARWIISDALYEFPDDAMLLAEMNGLDADEAAYKEMLLADAIQDIVDEAYSYADGGNWDTAIELLEKSQDQYTGNNNLLSAYEDIKAKMPITLKNITIVSSSSVETKKDVVKDRYGNIYDGAVRYDASNNAFALYNLNGLYVSFTSTIFTSTDASTGKKFEISIYLDEALVYFRDEITEETAPFVLSLDTTGASTMRIVTTNKGSWSSGHLYFGDTSFTKASDVAQQQNSLRAESAAPVATPAANNNAATVANTNQVQVETPTQNTFLISDSNKRYLSETDLDKLTWRECCLARNEIYARHGRMFSTKEIADYFGAKDWYNGTIDGPTFDANTGTYLNDYEKKNATYILDYETKNYGGSYY